MIKWARVSSTATPLGIPNMTNWPFKARPPKPTRYSYFVRMHPPTKRPKPNG
jgi:hypothetical protein